MLNEKCSLILKPTYQLFKAEHIPYMKMHDATSYWLPLLLNGEHIKATIMVNQPKNHFAGKVESFSLNWPIACMKKILLDKKEIEALVPESLPMLIHGEEGSGTSFYTICLAA